mgnify:CR=1 FL=1
MCFSLQAYASHRLVKLHEFSDYNIDKATLSSIYRDEDDYIWLDQHQLNDQAHIALEFIASAPEHGLNPCLLYTSDAADDQGLVLLWGGGGWL